MSDIAEVILEMHAQGASPAAIAAVFGVSRRTMQRWMRYANRRRRLPEDDRRALITWVHKRRHAGTSVRQIVKEIAEQPDLGLRRSVGWVHAVLIDWRCPDCSAAPNGANEQPVNSEADVQSRQMAQVNGGAS
jgi:transposase